MSQHPRKVLTGLMVPWPSSQFPIWVKAVTAVDIMPGSALEQALGTL